MRATTIVVLGLARRSRREERRRRPITRFLPLVALAPVRDLLLYAKHLFIEAMVTSCARSSGPEEILIETPSSRQLHIQK